MSAADGLTGNSDLQKRILFTLAMLAIYRLGVHVPTPGVDGQAVLGFFQNQGGIFGLFNTFTGGALNQFSIFALGIMPYISSSIIFQLLTAVVPALEQIKKEGEPGRKKITQYTRYGTVVLAVVQGYAISSWLMSSNFENRPLVVSTSVGILPFQVMTILTLTAGTCFIMWLGEQISERGFGDGSSLIIFAGIAAGIPKGAINLFEMVANKDMNGLVALAIVAMMAIVIGLIVFLEWGQRRIPIHFSQRGGRAMLGSQASHLPLKINLSGVIPPIFASSLLLFPATLAQFIKAPWVAALRDSLHPTGGLYLVLEVGLIVFFCFFYTEIVLNPVEMAENLKKGGKFIPGIRAGKSTSDYIQKVMDRINVGGAAYLCAIVVLPTLMIDKLKVPFYFGGTSILILVGVALNTTEKLQTYLMTQKYEGLLRGAKQRTRRVQF
ncbi:MAG: preprotein translocase subunit SecY [Bdellovibrionaceae bacterium]|nr:preprotein translocase subunit SecY [Pseudobdellovibrionaceae bacterium]